MKPLFFSFVSPSTLATFATLATCGALAGCAASGGGAGSSGGAQSPEATTLTSSQVPARAVANPDAAATGEDPNFKPETDETAPVDDSIAIDEWSKRYPDAASELHDWMGHYPVTAQRFAAWDQKEPIRMRTLVDWAVTHRYEGIGSFLYGRSGWSSFLDIVTADPDGAQELVEWIRRSAPAAEELSAHSDALAWATKNLKARSTHVPMAARSVAAPSDTRASSVAASAGGARPPADASSWYPTPGSMIR